MDVNDLNKVWEIKPLKKMIGEEEARKILEAVSKQVQPIMRNHGWKVNILSEFSPTNPSLLGLNIGGGAEVKLRLRRPNRDWEFIPYNHILDTMLHELCHNQFGPHNSDFYNLLDLIRKECEELMAKGITGTGKGFDLPGRRLGGFSHQSVMSSLRQNALEAAQNRVRNGMLLPSGPKRIGGDANIMDSLSPIQAAAMAAERRLHDDLWCGSKSLEQLHENTGSSTVSSTSPVFYGHASLPGTVIGQETEDSGVTWQCSACTLFNQSSAMICTACGTEKGRDGRAKSKVWSCKFCTLNNNIQLERCLACREWRYSSGPPVSASSPFTGT